MPRPRPGSRPVAHPALADSWRTTHFDTHRRDRPRCPSDPLRRLPDRPPPHPQLLLASPDPGLASLASTASEPPSRPARQLGERNAVVCQLGRDASRVGVRIGNGPAGLAQMREMRDECYGHPSLDLIACSRQSESTVHIRTVGTPGTVFGLFVDHEVVPQRKSRSPVIRRIAASVPTGTVSESLPETVTTRMPSALSHVSCEPVLPHPDPALRPQCLAHLSELLRHAPKLRGNSDGEVVRPPRQTRQTPADIRCFARAFHRHCSSEAKQ